MKPLFIETKQQMAALNRVAFLLPPWVRLILGKKRSCPFEAAPLNI
jgi:hypothetical protein